MTQILIVERWVGAGVLVLRQEPGEEEDEEEDEDEGNGKEEDDDDDDRRIRRRLFGMSVLVLIDGSAQPAVEAQVKAMRYHQRSAGALLEESLKGNTVPLRGDDVG